MKNFGCRTHFHRTAPAVAAFLLLLMNTVVTGQPDVFVKNITRSENVVEINPQFIGGGRHILYLEYTGELGEFAPWEYRLMLADRNGYSMTPLTESGVVEYSILPGDVEVLLLVANSFSKENIINANFYHDIQNWQIQRLNIKTLEKSTVFTSNGRPIVEGYNQLGVTGLPDWESEILRSQSPAGKREVLVRIEDEAGKRRVCFYSAVNNVLLTRLLDTEAYLTHSHFNWLPTIVWLDENSFITQCYDINPQGLGTFSIVKVDLRKSLQTVLLYEDGLKPFPMFSLDDMRKVLYFQRELAGGSTALYRLNLLSGKVDMVYESRFELGTVRSSLDGSALVVSRLGKFDSDIICLELRSRRISSFAGN